MNILDLSRSQIEEMVKAGIMSKSNLRHYDICRALAEGKTQEKIAEAFNLTDDSHVRKIKNKKCAECK